MVGKGKVYGLVLLMAVIATLLAGCAQQQAPTPGPTPTATPVQLQYGVKYKVHVVKVIDGDTIDVQFPDGKVERVRLLGVDTPEVVADKNKPNEYDSITDLKYLAEWGDKATEYAKMMLEGKDVYIEFDEMAGLRGYYGRLLAYVYLPDGTDFTAELVKNGYARVYTEGTFSKEEQYLQLERIARENKVGLWGWSPTSEQFDGSGSTTTETGVKISYVQYDAPGDDRTNLNGEYVTITNYDSTAVNLNSWILKDEAGNTYTFPNVNLNPGSSITVHTGSGTDTATDLYWGSSRPVWNNDGDTAYLYDANGNLVDSYGW